MKIYKYPLAHAAISAIPMPSGATILNVRLQEHNNRHKLMLWAEVDTTQPEVIRTIRLISTGEEFTKTGIYIATFQTGAFVGHIYDEGETPF